MAYGKSNGHVTDDIKWSYKSETHGPNVRLEPNVLKTVGDARLFSNNR